MTHEAQTFTIDVSPAKEERIKFSLLFKRYITRNLPWKRAKQRNYHNGIHTEEVNLLNVKESNDLPSWYPLFQLPYQIDVKVTCTGVHVYVEIIYIDLSPDPDIFVPYIYRDPSDEFIWRLYGYPSKENYISDY